jgi:magnesium chelatase subunit H
MGKFDMSAPASGLMALLKKLRGKANETADNKAESGAKAPPAKSRCACCAACPRSCASSPVPRRTCAPTS